MSENAVRPGELTEQDKRDATNFQALVGVIEWSYPDLLRDLLAIQNLLDPQKRNLRNLDMNTKVGKLLIHITRNEQPESTETVLPAPFNRLQGEDDVFGQVIKIWTEISEQQRDKASDDILAEVDLGDGKPKSPAE